MFRSIEDTIKGGIFGLAVGDALGAPIEFMTAEAIKKKYGRLTEMVGGGWLNLRPGEFTDDTQMMLCVAQGLIENPLDPVEAVGRHFMEWFHSNPKDIGVATKQALHAVDLGIAWEKAGGETAEGNGCLMRTLPISFAYTGMERIEVISQQIARMTHKATQAVEVCTVYNQIAYMVLTEHRKYVTVSVYPKPAEPTGRCLDTLHNALWAFLTTDSFEDAVIKVVNLGGDADTAGAVCGGLAGTFYGYDAIPKRWLGALECKNELEEVASGLFELRQRVDQL